LGWAVFIAFAILGALGFDPKMLHPPAVVLDHLRLAYVLIPAALSSVCLLLALRYPIGEREQRRLRDEIEERRAQSGSAADGMHVVFPSTAPTGFGSEGKI
jgi:Na+/melibiose symporter-like transporter